MVGRLSDYCAQSLIAYKFQSLAHDRSHLIDIYYREATFNIVDFALFSPKENMAAIGTGIATAMLGGVMGLQSQGAPPQSRSQATSPNSATATMESTQENLGTAGAPADHPRYGPRRQQRAPPHAIVLEYWPNVEVFGGGIMPANGLDLMQRLAGYKHVGLIIDISGRQLGAGSLPESGKAYDLESASKSGQNALRLGDRDFRRRNNRYEFVGYTTMDPAAIAANGESSDLSG